VTFLSGDDLDAKAEVISLFEDAGFFTIDLGALTTGGAMQQLGAPLSGVDLIRMSDDLP
jgi:predicted dinucleotide-binding enzyme